MRPTILLLPLLLTFTGLTPAIAQTQTADGAAVMSTACIGCHNLRIIANARRSRASWAATVGDMIQRGAPVFPEERTILIDYLGETLGPNTAKANPANEDQRKKTEAPR